MNTHPRTGIYRITILLLGITLLIGTPLANGQDTLTSDLDVQSNATTETQPLFLQRVSFEGHHAFSTQTLQQITRSRPNRGLFGIQRIKPWYALYQLTGRFGEEPAILDPLEVAKDEERLRLFYESMGYRSAIIRSSIQQKDQKAQLIFTISEGARVRLESVDYVGFPSALDEQTLTSFLKEGPYLESTRRSSELLPVERPFMTQELRGEQDRIITFLRNHAYGEVTKDSVILFIEPNASDTTKVRGQFRILPGQSLRIGPVHFIVEGPSAETEEASSPTRLDTLSSNGFDVTSAMAPNAGVSISQLASQNRASPGQAYRQNSIASTLSQFQRQPAFRLQEARQAGAIQYDSLGGIYPLEYSLTINPKHSLQFELFGMERYGFGTGVGATYNNNNVGRRGHFFDLRLNSNFEYVTSSTLASISESPSAPSGTLFRSLDATMTYTIPSLGRPLRFLESTLGMGSAFTRHTLSFTRANQLYFDINSTIRYATQVDIQLNDVDRHIVDIIDLSLIDTNPSDAFRENVELQFPDDPVQVLRILEDFRPQISSAVRYTFRRNTTDLIKRNRGVYYEYSVSMGGTLPYLLDRLIITPNTLERSLPPILALSDNRLEYSQFVKVTLDRRRYIPLGSSTVFATRFFGGFAQPFTYDQIIPLNQRFFAGGSNDIRGWEPFRLGPGATPQSEVTRPGGDIKLAAFMEVRRTVVESSGSGDIQLAWFVDSGNIWYGPQRELRGVDNQNILDKGVFTFDAIPKQMAVSSGLGLRFDWEFVVARVDFSLRAHDPLAGWFNSKKMYFSFGIGHSF
ncbi:MAG: outer membrane protein assembly factor [Rhodothermaeota bacterium MED-G64]|nr:MAG: outer membrane protein assembly factor [Rhodothermaeota bacterium MED-G64]|tara:strand:+ start:7904 stop:10306 length:2403 start_codon:yes stop_codon:yes gene_type:complete